MKVKMKVKRLEKRMEISVNKEKEISPTNQVNMFQDKKLVPLVELRERQI